MAKFQNFHPVQIERQNERKIIIKYYLYHLSHQLFSSYMYLQTVSSHSTNMTSGIARIFSSEGALGGGGGGGLGFS